MQNRRQIWCLLCLMPKSRVTESGQGTSVGKLAPEISGGTNKAMETNPPSLGQAMPLNHPKLEGGLLINLGTDSMPLLKRQAKECTLGNLNTGTFFLTTSPCETFLIQSVTLKNLRKA